jgi:hypothetical protein
MGQSPLLAVKLQKTELEMFANVEQIANSIELFFWRNSHQYWRNPSEHFDEPNTNIVAV